MPRRTGDKKQLTARAFMNNPPPVPEYIEMTDAARQLWPILSCSRDSNTWSTVELLLLARACELEIDKARCRAQLGAMGYLVYDAKGVPKSNPLVQIMRQCSLEQMTIFARLSLGHGKEMKRGRNAGNVYEGDFSQDDNLLSRRRKF